MNKNKKKYPPIRPQFLKDAKGKVKQVYVEYHIYRSIIDEMTDLGKKIEELKKKTNLKL
jgi:hypothetical protein